MITLNITVVGRFLLCIALTFRAFSVDAFSNRFALRPINVRTSTITSQFAIETDKESDDKTDASMTNNGVVQKLLRFPRTFMSNFRKKESSVDEMVSYELSTNSTSLQTKTESADEATDDKSEESQLLKQIKEAGTAGVISYAVWELGFWFVSIPVVALGYYNVVGHWPDINNGEDVAKLSAEAFAFVNFARFAVPLRIGLALSTTPWIQKNVVDKYLKKE
jgi:hypothetical protein